MSVNEQLWAPWRIGYIIGDESTPAQSSQPELNWEPGADPGCFLCRAVADHAAGSEKQNLLVARHKLAVAVLNRYPYNNGHLLIAPCRHIPKLQGLESEEYLALMNLVSQACGILEQTMNAEGFNIGLNLGRVGGAGLPGHLHWHVVPRWNGDTNFMPVLNGANIISQALDAAWALLSQAFAEASE
jgi:ATP adenylyltransferase